MQRGFFNNASNQEKRDNDLAPVLDEEDARDSEDDLPSLSSSSSLGDPDSDEDDDVPPLIDEDGESVEKDKATPAPPRQPDNTNTTTKANPNQNPNTNQNPNPNPNPNQSTNMTPTTTSKPSVNTSSNSNLNLEVPKDFSDAVQKFYTHYNLKRDMPLSDIPPNAIKNLPPALLAAYTVGDLVDQTQALSDMFKGSPLALDPANFFNFFPWPPPSSTGQSNPPTASSTQKPSAPKPSSTSSPSPNPPSTSQPAQFFSGPYPFLSSFPGQPNTPTQSTLANTTTQSPSSSAPTSTDDAQTVTLKKDTASAQSNATTRKSPTKKFPKPVPTAMKRSVRVVRRSGDESKPEPKPTIIPSAEPPKVLKTKKEIQEITDPIVRAEEYKTVANQLLQDGQYEKSVRYYTKAIEEAKQTPGPNLAVYYSNRGLAHLKFQNFGSAATDESKAIKIDGNYPKAYYRRGCAYTQLKKFKEAQEDFNMVLYLLPKDTEALRQLKLVESEMKKNGGALQQTKPTSASNQPPPATPPPPPSVPRAALKMPPVISPPHIPMPWSPSISMRVPMLIDLAARSIAQEAANHVSFYLESFRQIPADLFKQIVVYMDWPTLQEFRRSPFYRDHVNSSLIYSGKKVEEDYYRTLFAMSHSHPAIQDPYLTLIDVHKHLDLFNYEQEDAYEASIPKLLQSPKSTEGLAVVSHQQFIENFNVFTHNQLRCLDWDGVFVAGGSVLAALMPGPKMGLWDYYHTGCFRNSDIDLFVFGKTIEQANKKLLEIYEQIKQHDPAIEYIAFRTLNVITLVSHFPRRHIQIVLRLYKSPAEILMGFDIDSCCVGFNGLKVFAHPRCARALKLQFNMVDLSRRSKSYEYRLYKYSKRGFAVAVPGLDLSRIDPSVHPYKQATLKWINPHRFPTGLGRLLYWDHEMRLVREGHRLYESSDHGGIPRADKFYLEKEQTLKLEHEPSDYASICIPYGPNWQIGDCVRHATLINRTVNTGFFRLYISEPPRPEITLCLIGSMSEVLKDGANITVFLKDDKINSLRVIDKHNMWLTENPGQQLTGSFQPINAPEEEWFKYGYTAKKTK